jgi:type II secretory ATPase GspE/PulE/Tfp pilus assembly ATPase PilB-like protein
MASTNQDKAGTEPIAATEAAKRLGITEAELETARREGRVQAVRGTWGRKFYRPSDLEGYAPANGTSSSAKDGSSAAARAPGAPVNASLTRDIVDPKQSPVIQTSNGLIAQALELGASEVYLRLERDAIHVHFRVDGLLIEGARISRDIWQPLANRFRTMAGISPTGGSSHVGMFPLTIPSRDFAVRVVSVPSYTADTLTLRIFEQVVEGELGPLGMNSDLVGKLGAWMHAPAGGLLAITGVHGSGLSTTAFAVLSALASVDRYAVVVSPLPEYTVRGMPAAHLHTLPGLDGAVTPASLSRTVQSLDPDVLLLDDVGDDDMAAVAVEAALSGRRVIATVAARDVSSARWRLARHGVTPDALSRTLWGVIVQRLVRRRCTACADGVDREFRGSTCVVCRGVGYRGRIGLFALLQGPAALAPEADVSGALWIAGQQVIAAGVTTQEEITRVLG